MVLFVISGMSACGVLAANGLAACTKELLRQCCCLLGHVVRAVTLLQQAYPEHTCCLCCSLWYKRDTPGGPALQRLREGALTALGLIIIGRPQLMLQPLQLSLLDHQHSAGALANSAHSGGSGDAGSPEDRPQRQLSAQGSGALHGPLAGDNVVKVYTTVLSEPHVSMSVKGRVLTNLVDLLRWVWAG